MTGEIMLFSTTTKSALTREIERGYFGERALQ
jgi:hypothetical protein